MRLKRKSVSFLNSPALQHETSLWSPMQITILLSLQSNFQTSKRRSTHLLKTLWQGQKSKSINSLIQANLEVLLEKIEKRGCNFLCLVQWLKLCLKNICFQLKRSSWKVSKQCFILTSINEVVQHSNDQLDLRTLALTIKRMSTFSSIKASTFCFDMRFKKYLDKGLLEQFCNALIIQMDKLLLWK